MLKSKKILLKMTGSIACYKACDLISKLVQSGAEVKVVCTKNSLNFIGASTIEGLTGEPPLTDQFQQKHAMDHINLMRWADLIIVCPATANFINKIACGIGDELAHSLFLAHDFTKPYLIAPAMNTSMYDHPSVKHSLSLLRSWGVNVLKTNAGSLACGEYGAGRLLEVSELLKAIENQFEETPVTVKKTKKILITSGGTREKIDGVRFITNVSTGKTGSLLAEQFMQDGYEVVYLGAQNGVRPEGNDYEYFTYTDFSSLNNLMMKLLVKNHFDAVVHLAAVSDYSVNSILLDDKEYSDLKSTKISSDSHLSIKFKRNFKILERIYDYSKNKNINIVAFKLTNSQSDEVRRQAIEKVTNTKNVTAVVHNDLTEINSGNHLFRVYENSKDHMTFSKPAEVAKRLQQIFSREHTANKIGVDHDLVP